MYTDRNFPSKKALKEALAKGEQITVYDPGFGNAPKDGTVYLEGPHFPKPHTWYAQGEMKDGLLTKVK